MVPKRDAEFSLCIEWGIPWTGTSFGDTPRILIERYKELKEVEWKGMIEYQRRMKNEVESRATLNKFK